MCYKLRFLLFSGILFCCFDVQSQLGLHVAENQTVLFGSDTTGVGAKLYWVPSKGAFRAGGIGDIFGNMGGDTTAWDYDSIGVLSTALGIGNIASKRFSMAWGSRNKAIGTLATAWGDQNQSEGPYTTTWGMQNKSTGNYSTTWGFLNESSFGSTTWGVNNESIGVYTTTFGGGNKAQSNLETYLGYTMIP